MSLTGRGLRLAQGVSARLPLPRAMRLAEGLADAWWFCAPQKRLAVQQNLAVILGKPSSECIRLSREVFRNFGLYLVEFLTLHQKMTQWNVQVEGKEHLLAAQSHRRGTIILTGHLGNWELGAAALRQMGFPVAAVALPHDQVDANQLFNRQRERCGIQVIPLGPEAASRSLQSLQEGCLLGLLGDWVRDERPFAVRAYGRRMLLSRGPATLSLRAKAPIVPSFFIRNGLGKFRLFFEPPIWPLTSVGEAASAEQITQAFADRFEGYLKRFPEQWLMFRSIPMAD